MDNMENLEPLAEASEEPKKKRKLYVPLSALVIYLMVASFLATGVNFSKYISTTNATDETKIAGFEVVSTHDTGVEPGLYLDAHYYEVDESIYNFTVQSNSKTTVRYVVEVTGVPEGVLVVLDDMIEKAPTNLSKPNATAPCMFGTVTFDADDIYNGNEGSVHPISYIPIGDTGVRTHKIHFVPDTSWDIPSSYYPVNIKVIAYQVD